MCRFGDIAIPAFAYPCRAGDLEDIEPAIGIIILCKAIAGFEAQARETIDRKGVSLLQQWILSLPGRPVLDPPTLSKAGGTYEAPIEVSLQDSEPGADIRYTMDGSEPGLSDMHYEKPIQLTAPTVLRARAFKDGFTRSITSQEVFIIGP